MIGVSRNTIINYEAGGVIPSAKQLMLSNMLNDAIAIAPQNDVIDKLLDYSGLNAKSFSEKIGLDRPQAIYDIQKGKTKSITISMANKILSVFPEIDKGWIMTGEGEMLKGGESKIKFYDPDNIPQSKKLIPFYDDVSTIGGHNSIIADVDAVSYPTSYIDVGDWFREATHAVRHYGDSMIEYPSGCILAIKEVKETQLIVWGRNYIIETNEYRITKRVQRGKSDDYIKAHSSNIAAYHDGQLIHEPLDIAWADIRKLFLVLGYVVKQNGETFVAGK
jgi:transcriptional regulator with XRE-family HTH domain